MSSNIWTMAIYKYCVGNEKGNGGALCGIDGGVWGRSETFCISLEEVRNSWKLLNNPKLIKSVVICGVNFEVVEINEDLNYVCVVSPKYGCGCTLIPTKKGFVIGYYDPPITKQQNIDATLKFSEYVLDVGY